jgi:hypothetical protein
MHNFTPLASLLGGILIGLSAAAMLLQNYKPIGISLSSLSRFFFAGEGKRRSSRSWLRENCAARVRVLRTPR